jgi:hypothetical protein
MKITADARISLHTIHDDIIDISLIRRVYWISLYTPE